MTRPLLLSAALLLAACNTNVDPQFRVKDVRILAVRSRVLPPTPVTFPSADAAPGETVTLDVLAVNPLGRPGFSIDWFACLPTASDAVSPCADLATLQDPSRLAALASASNPTVLRVGTGPTVQLSVPALSEALQFVIETARRQPAFVCRMYAEILVVVVASAEGKFSLAAKTVRVKPPSLPAGVADEYVLNLNPAVDAVVRAPTDADACTGGTAVGPGPFPLGKTTLCGRPADGSAQGYNVCGPTVRAADEGLGWQWYASDGDFPGVGGVGNATGDHVDFTRPGGPFTLWAILRDGRGGTDWVSFDVSAAP